LKRIAKLPRATNLKCEEVVNNSKVFGKGLISDAMNKRGQTKKEGKSEQRVKEDVIEITVL